jgi:hypothetical protein
MAIVLRGYEGGLVLCDDLINARWHTHEGLKSHYPTLEPEPFADRPLPSKQEMERLSPEERTRLSQELKTWISVADRNAKRLHEYGALFRSIDGRGAFCVAGQGISEAEFPEFRTKLEAAHKFSITDSFRLATLSRLATPGTVMKAKELFRLSHNPMWIEWREPDSDIGGNWRCGTLLYQSSNSGPADILGYDVGAIENGWCIIGSYRFDPTSLRFEGDALAIDAERTDSGCAEDREETSGSPRDFALCVTDFVIRINSPRITEISPCDDLSAINRKRQRNGKLSLFSYNVVDLNKDVKAGLRAIEHAELADEAEGGKQRQHWRRGHFKCCRTGVFWWNPHLAGRAQLGVIEKEYAA